MRWLFFSVLFVHLSTTAIQAQILDDFEVDDGGWRQGTGSLPLVADAGEAGVGDTALQVISAVPGPRSRIVILS